VAVVFEERSYRSLVPEFGVDDHTLAKMVGYQRPILDALCHQAGVWARAEED